MNPQSDGRPNTKQVFAELKDFQRTSAEYIFRRLYLDPKPARRFLLADEVGLGKTHVARGVIAKAIDHLWEEGIERIDVIYICSSADIARQNITKLNVTDRDDFALPSRITLLPTAIHDIKKRRVNFVSFTPGTSFDLKSNLGRSDERVLLYWLLRGPWRLKGLGPQNVLQGGTSRENFRRQVRSFKANKYIDSELRRAFLQGLRQHDEQLKEEGETTLRRRFKGLARQFHRARENAKIPEKERRERNVVVGELRRVLAGTCIKALEPDLIILDEFQRFKHLLDGEDPASELAQELFDYEEARVLLVSATPYKMYTVGHESAKDDHYVDFLRTVRFLANGSGSADRCEKLIAEFRKGLYQLAEGDDTRIYEVKLQLEEELRRVMVRTERLAVSDDRNGMLVHEPSPGVRLEPQDLAGYVSMQRVARVLTVGDPMEYWKSAPYLLNFMDDYQVKRKFQETCGNRFRVGELAECLAGSKNLLLPWRAIRRYREVDSLNARLRDLVEVTVGSGAWKMLWIAPSLPYYQLGGVYEDEQLRCFTKRLVFSGWRVVPKALATLVSYEAERRMITSFDGKAKNTVQARKQRRGLLQFTRSQGRLTGMPLLGLLYPSLSLARRFDPRRLAAMQDTGELPSLEQVVTNVADQIALMLKQLGIATPSSGPVDETWYWAAPVLLDRLEDPEATEQWWRQEDLAAHWSDEALGQEGDATRFEDHLLQVQKLLDGEVTLGRLPSDLAHVLAQMAVAGPGVCTLRALSRVYGGSEVLGVPTLRNMAARATWSMRALFNLPEAMGLIRGRNGEEPYWRRVLEYCAEGCLQAVLDEYVHVLAEILGLAGKELETASEKLVDVINSVIGLHVSNLGVDNIRTCKAPASVDIQRQTMRARFAMRFGDEKSDEDASVQRAGVVRQAFNSPFWPFVLVTTSVGQEGLDFHPYCHAVVHWNLPSNPVDFEQREGRVHRYKGHAIRKNVAARHASAIHAEDHDDPWRALFDAAVEERAEDSSDLVPYWIYATDGGAKIQRFVPALPLSRELDRLMVMQRSLAVYRMVFGQPRQDDLLEHLMDHISQEELLEQLDRLRINLTPCKGA